MKVFVSWSGSRSRQVADALSDWIRKVIQSSDVFYSPEIDRGKRWSEEIAKSLEQDDIVGVICVTPENEDARWINYEAGALSRHVGEGRVVPYLFGYHSPSDLGQPLGHFNAAMAGRDGTWQLVQTLNNCSKTKMPEMVLSDTFDVWWPKLEKELQGVDAVDSAVPATRSDPEKLDEVLDLVRSLSRRIIRLESRVDHQRSNRDIRRMMARITGNDAFPDDFVDEALSNDNRRRSVGRQSVTADRNDSIRHQDGVQAIMSRHAPFLESYESITETKVIATGEALEPGVIAKIENDIQMLTGHRPKVIFQPRIT